MSIVTVEQAKSVKLEPVVEEEIQRLKTYHQEVVDGKMDPNIFKKFRLNNGVYGIRNETQLHMIRIKCKYGIIDSDQMDTLAHVTEKFTRLKMCHITTRQAIQIHHVHIKDVPYVLRMINGCGLTSREACGNTVRNITANPFAGLMADEAFDVRPYAEALFQHYLRNPLTQNFSRKFKIALHSGSGVDIAYTAIHDIGLIAKTQKVDGKEVKGFHVYVGGGLGASPFMAIRLEEFTPLSELFTTCDAIVRIFDRHGDRKDKFHARLKFVVKKFGEEAFKKMVLEERLAVKATQAGGWKWNLPENISDEKPPVLVEKINANVKPEPDFELWRRTNVHMQKNKDYSAVVVVTPLGDLTVQQMKDLAAMARKYNGGQLRTMVQQNMVLPWIKNEYLVPLFSELKAAGLGTAGALRLSDVTRCPGADTCQIAVTKSRGLAGAILHLFENGLGADMDMKDLSIKISGCTNSCGQHHIGNIGFFGTYRKINGHEVPHYQVLLGGDVKEGHAQFGKPVHAIPAKRVPEVVKHLVSLYKKEKKADERFVVTMERLGRDRLRQELEVYRNLPPHEENPDLYREWGENHEFKAEIGQGECAA